MDPLSLSKLVMLAIQAYGVSLIIRNTGRK